MDDGNQDLVHGIYAAATGELPWQQIVAEVVQAFGAGSAQLFTYGLASTTRAQDDVSVSFRMQEHLVQQYLAEVEDVDEWYHALTRRHGPLLPTGFTFDATNLVPENALRRTRFFADYLVGLDIQHCIGTIISDGTRGNLPVATLSIYRPFGTRPFEATDQVRLQSLQRHLHRAVHLRCRLREAADATLASTLERLSTAVAVLARDRRVLGTNPAAERLLSSIPHRLVRAGKLVAEDATQNAALDKALAACATYRFDPELSLSVRLQGPPGAGIVARCVPLPSSIPGQARAAALAFLAAEGRCPLDLRALLASLYRLTPAETSLVLALAEGLTPEEYRERRQIALGTVKTQMQSVFAKTGTRRQADLMRLVLSVAH